MGAPPMSMPHLDTRVITGRDWLLFGPFAGWSPKFLKTGKATDLPLSVKPNNLFSMIGVGLTELPLLKYLIGELLQSFEDRVDTLRQFAPTAVSNDWELAIAGQRVQVIRRDPKKLGILEFGTTVLAAADGSIAGLRASPGASTAVPAMLEVMERCFPDRYPSWGPKLKEMTCPRWGPSSPTNPDCSPRCGTTEPEFWAWSAARGGVTGPAPSIQRDRRATGCAWRCCCAPCGPRSAGCSSAGEGHRQVHGGAGLAAIVTQAAPGARLVELPIGATEDRVVGSLDLQKVLRDGEHAFSPGLLARAHGGVLYVDEVNLLPDHLVDILLDAAAMGRVHIERDGVSHSHESRFVPIGTMNPEEGELRPQLLDRFGLAVDVQASREVAVRSAVVRSRLAYEADPAGFAARFADEDAELSDRSPPPGRGSMT